MATSELDNGIRILKGVWLSRNGARTFYEHSEDIFRVLGLEGDEHKTEREQISERLFILGRMEWNGWQLEAVRLEEQDG